MCQCSASWARAMPTWPRLPRLWLQEEPRGHGHPKPVRVQLWGRRSAWGAAVPRGPVRPWCHCQRGTGLRGGSSSAASRRRGFLQGRSLPAQGARRTPIDSQLRALSSSGCGLSAGWMCSLVTGPRRSRRSRMTNLAEGHAGLWLWHSARISTGRGTGR